jgi:hypothetical protein
MAKIVTKNSTFSPFQGEIAASSEGILVGGLLAQEKDEERPPEAKRRKPSRDGI